jgi:hypothetical protein
MKISFFYLKTYLLERKKIWVLGFTAKLDRSKKTSLSCPDVEWPLDIICRMTDQKETA